MQKKFKISAIAAVAGALLLATQVFATAPSSAPSVTPVVSVDPTVAPTGASVTPSVSVSVTPTQGVVVPQGAPQTGRSL